MSQKGSLFTADSVGNAVASSVDFLKDSFVDTVLPPTNNTGLTSNALTNPFGVFVANAESVQYGVKTLWIKGIQLIEDRTKWINTQPTYEVLFHETYPGLFCYAALRNAATDLDQFYEPFRNTDPETKPFYLGSNDDWIFGVTGRFRRVAFLAGKGGVSGRLTVDGVDAGAFGYMTATTQASVMPYQMFYSPAIHASANATDDLHDVRLIPTPATASNPSLFGIQVFFENSGANVLVGPGISYNDKTKLTTTSGSTYAVPVFGSSLGGVAQYVKTSSGAYATYLFSPTTISTIGQGSINTNLISVSSGHGASYPSGTGFVIDQGGGSFYIGSVQSVSTDTLTVGPTLPFGISNTLTRRWSSGPTLSIGSSLYFLALSWEPEFSFGSSTTPGSAGFNPLCWYEPINNIGVYGFVNFTGPAYVPLAAMNLTSSSYIQCSGNFSAAEVEWSGLCFTNLITVKVNGQFGFTSSLQLGDGFDATGSTVWISRMTMFKDAGVGVNEFRIEPGATLEGVGIRRINFYQYRDQGASLGVLATLDRNQAYADGSSIALGLDRRVPSTFFGYTGAWGFDNTDPPTSSRAIVTGTNAGSFKYQYYGKNFAILGQAGQSSVLNVDGVSISPTFNQMLSVGTEGWHELEYIHKAGTGSGGRSLIRCIDYAKTFREVEQLQNDKAVPKRKIAIPIFKDFGSTVLQIKGSTSDPTKPASGVAADFAHCRREGRYLILEYRYAQTAAGLAGSGQYTLPLPFGLRIDTRFGLGAPGGDVMFNVGSASLDGGGTAYGAVHAITIGGISQLYVEHAAATWSSGQIGDLSNTVVDVGFMAKVPILGWSDYEYIEVNDG